MGKDTSLWNLKKSDSGKIYKGLPLATLKTWILEVRIDADDYVTNATLKKWVRVSKIEELTPFFAPESLGTDVISSEDLNLGWHRQGENQELEIDMTPMIDVTFLLLIFFMVTATFAIHEVKSIKNPQAKHLQKYKQEKLSVSVYKDKSIYIGKEQVSLKNFEKRLKARVAKTQQQDIVLSADKSLDYGFVVEIMDQITGAGIKDIKLKLERKK